MPTVGDVYDPLIEAALAGNEEGHELLRDVGREIHEANPERCPDVDDGIEAARRNLAYYAKYRSEEDRAAVSGFYGLETEFAVLAPSSPSP